MSSIGAPEILLILLVLILLFGARKLPDLARGTGRALRIFKSETKGLVDDDDDESDDRRTADNARAQITSSRSQPDAVDPSAPRQAQTIDLLPTTHTEK